MPLVPSTLVPASLKAKEVATVDYVDGELSNVDVSYEALTGKDLWAQQLGYADYAALEAAAAGGSTVINGGYINTGLLKADGGYITNAMIGDTIHSGNYVTGVSGWCIKK